MTYSRRVVLVVSLVATAGLTLLLGVTDPAPPLSYPDSVLRVESGVGMYPGVLCGRFRRWYAGGSG